MKNLETLIQELCPDGVEFVKLGDVIQSINTGLNPRRFFSLNTPDANNFYEAVAMATKNMIDVYQNSHEAPFGRTVAKEDGKPLFEKKNS